MPVILNHSGLRHFRRFITPAGQLPRAGALRALPHAMTAPTAWQPPIWQGCQSQDGSLRRCSGPQSSSSIRMGIRSNIWTVALAWSANANWIARSLVSNAAGCRKGVYETGSKASQGSNAVAFAMRMMTDRGSMALPSVNIQPWPVSLIGLASNIYKKSGASPYQISATSYYY